MKQSHLSVQHLVLPLVALAVALAVTAPPAPTEGKTAKELLWPTVGQKGVSSNFCEYRLGHFHAGIDVRSFGAEGIPCVAVADGYIERVRASSGGYGKALYLRLNTGETCVYAHLSEFAPEIEAELLAQQQRRGTYKIDFRLPQTRFTVKRGDVIAYSGRTGTTDPHLHFEIRDPGQRPLDPFAHGFGLPDPTPPEFRRIALVPRDVEARIGGGVQPRWVRVESTGPGRYRAEVSNVTGAVGLAVEVFDRIDENSGRLAPARLQLRQGDELLVDLRFDQTDFTTTDRVDWIYDVARVRLDKDYFFHLFQRPGGEWSGLDVRDSWLRAPVAVTVTAWDRAGNRSDLDLTLTDDADNVKGSHRPFLGAIPGVAAQDGWVEIQSDFVVDGSSPRSAGASGFEHWEDGPYEVSFQPYEAGKSTSLYIVGVRAGQPRSVPFAALNLEVIFGERTFAADKVVFAAPWSGRGQDLVMGQLVRHNWPVLIGPYSALLERDMEIRFIVPDATPNHAVFRLNERKLEWQYYPSVVHRDVVATTAKRPGVYAVLSDNEPPSILRPVVKRWQSHSGKVVRNEIHVPIEDTGSGFDPERGGAYLNGIKQIARWDGTDKKWFIQIYDKNIIGQQAISIVAYDQIGNRTQLDTTIDVPRLN